MSDNTLAAIIFCTLISSCTACTISDRWLAEEREQKRTPLERCYRDALTDNGREHCRKTFAKQQAKGGA